MSDGSNFGNPTYAPRESAGYVVIVLITIIPTTVIYILYSHYISHRTQRAINTTNHQNGRPPMVQHNPTRPATNAPLGPLQPTILLSHHHGISRLIPLDTPGRRPRSPPPPYDAPPEYPAPPEYTPDDTGLVADTIRQFGSQFDNIQIHVLRTPTFASSSSDSSV